MSKENMFSKEQLDAIREIVDESIKYTFSNRIPSKYKEKIQFKLKHLVTKETEIIHRYESFCEKYPGACRPAYRPFDFSDFCKKYPHSPICSPIYEIPEISIPTPPEYIEDLFVRENYIEELDKYITNLEEYTKEFDKDF